MKSLIAFLLCLFVAGSAQAACDYPTFAAGPGNPCTPAVPGYNILLGDSLIAGATEWTNVIANDSPVYVTNAIPGAGIMHNPYWIPRIAALGQKFPNPTEVWVLLGSNDSLTANGILVYGDLSNYQAQVNLFLNAIESAWPNVQTIRWLLPSQTLPDGNYPPLAVYVVSVGIANNKSAHPKLRVRDPYAAFNACYSTCFYDGVHFTPAGVFQAKWELLLAQ